MSNPTAEKLSKDEFFTATRLVQAAEAVLR